MPFILDRGLHLCVLFFWFFFFQIEILLGKTENFDELMAAAAEEREAAGDGEDQS